MRLCTLWVCVALLGAGSANGETRLPHKAPEDRVYDLYVGGLQVAELTLGAEIGEDSYRATSSMRTAGVIGRVFKGGFDAQSVGKVGIAGLEPARFVSASEFRGNARTLEMVYSASGPDLVRTEPVPDREPHDIDPREQSGTSDPITSAIAHLSPAPPEDICGRRIDIYDGRKRYALELGAPEVDGDRLRCASTYHRVAGFEPEKMAERRSFPLDVWYETRPDGLAEFVRAAADSKVGLLVILLRQ